MAEEVEIDDEEYTPVENQEIVNLTDENFEQIFHPQSNFFSYTLDLFKFRGL